MSLGDLKKEIRKAFLFINTSKRERITNPYETFTGRLFNLIINNDNEINYYTGVHV